MAYRVIPQTYEYICDFCEAVQTTPRGPVYTAECPPEWMLMRLESDDSRFASTTLLCTACALRMLDAVEKTRNETGSQ